MGGCSSLVQVILASFDAEVVDGSGWGWIVGGMVDGNGMDCGRNGGW